MIKGKLTVLSLFLVVTTYAQHTDAFFLKSDAFFKTYVLNGRVAYADIQKDKGALDEILNLAKQISVSKDDREVYQSFWINGYNLLVINEIVRQYPIKSPLDQPGFFDKKAHNIGGKEITLNAIENELLRGNFPSEARFHFVLVCAGLGCPPIVGKAYLPRTLEDQLQEQTVLALNDPKFIRTHKNKVRISQIFEWYKGDFQQNGLDLLGYINQYRKEKLPKGSKISFYDYDWSLNDLK